VCVCVCYVCAYVREGGIRERVGGDEGREWEEEEWEGMKGESGRRERVGGGREGGDDGTILATVCACTCCRLQVW